MIPEKCPHCGMAWNETMGEYECGSYPAGSSVVCVTVCTEISRLQAELAQAARLVVPDLAPDGMSTAAFVDGYRFAQSRSHSVPSSRVLKDGEVAVDAEEWEAMCSLGFDPEPCRLDHHGYCQEHNWFSEKPCPTATLQKLSVRQLHEDRQNEGVRMTTQRKPSPEVDHGGRVFYVEDGKVYEGRRSEYSCDPCHFVCALSCDKRRRACYGRLNGERGHRTLHPVQAVG